MALLQVESSGVHHGEIPMISKERLKNRWVQLSHQQEPGFPHQQPIAQGRCGEAGQEGRAPAGHHDAHTARGDAHLPREGDVLRTSCFKRTGR